MKFIIRDPTSREFLDAEKSIIDLFMPDQESKKTLPDLPSSKDVFDHFLTILPYPSIIFTEKYFVIPLFAIGLLRITAELFGFSDASAEYTALIGPSNQDNSDGKLMLHVWLCKVLELESQTCQEIVTRFK